MQHRRLILAFVGIGLVSGFMVAASESPVVSAALPVLAGLVAAAITAISGRVNVDQLMGRVDALRTGIEKSPAEVTKATIEAWTRSNEAILRQAHATVGALGSLTLAFIVFFAVGLGLGVWGRVDGAIVRVLSPLTGPWDSSRDGSGGAMPPSAPGAIYWLGLEQQLRWAGVPPHDLPPVRGLPRGRRASRGQYAKDGADPTETELSEAWNAIASSPSAIGGADSSPAGVLRVGDVPRPQVPGVLKREADDVREMLRREIVDTLDEQLPVILEHQAGSWPRDAVDHGLIRDELEVWFERHVAPEVNRMVGDLVAPSGLEQRTELWLHGYFDSDAFRGSVEELLRVNLAPTLNRSIEEYRRLLDEPSPAGGSR